MKSDPFGYIVNGSKLSIGVESVRKDKEQDKQETEKLLQTGRVRASAQEWPGLSAGTSKWGRLGVKLTVLGRGQVRGGLLHGLYPSIVVAHQNALKGLAKTPCAVWGVV